MISKKGIAVIAGFQGVSNKNRITLTQVVDDKDRIKFASLARDVIEANEITNKICQEIIDVIERYKKENPR